MPGLKVAHRPAQELDKSEFLAYYNNWGNTEISLFDFFEFLRKFKKLKFKIFEFSAFLNFNSLIMFVKTYENLDSSAINTLKVDKESVFVVYNSNTDKEYEFKCENTQEFDEKVSKTLQNKESIGKLLNSSIKQQELVAVTK